MYGLDNTQKKSHPIPICRKWSILSLVQETLGKKNWVLETLRRENIALYSVDGYSVMGKKVTGLFEKRKSTVEVEKWSRNQIANWLETKEDKKAWLAKLVLAGSLGVRLYLIIWQDGRESSRVLYIGVDNLGRIDATQIERLRSYRELAEWFRRFKGIQVSKRFFGRIPTIDRCLRLHGVPWPGDLDGFLLSNAPEKVKAIFDLSNTERHPVESHDLNRYFKIDINRWKPPDILRKQLNVPLYVIIWSSKEKLVKIHKLREVTDNGLEFESTELLTDQQLVPWFVKLSTE